MERLVPGLLRRAAVIKPNPEVPMSELQKNQLHTAAVTGYTAEGLGVARVDGRVVFVHGGVRGELCSLRILKVRKNVAYARVEEVLEDRKSVV